MARGTPLVVCAALLTACGGGDNAPRATASALAVSTPQPASSLATSLTTDQLLDWAEIRWPGLFPVGALTHGQTAGGVDYQLRFYAGTGNYIGVAPDGGVWGLGPFTGDTLKGFGNIADFDCQVAPQRCTPIVASCTQLASGFTGDLNALYGARDAGGDGSADGDGGSAGVGGSEGKVLGARVRVLRLADGARLAEGTTDTERGLVTVRWCQADLPVMLEMQGAPGARYFDEAVGDLVDFPATQTLHALIDRFDENIGLSSLTEAAYQYAARQASRSADAARRRPLAAGRTVALDAHRSTRLSSGVPLGLGRAQVQAANARVLAEVNRQFGDRLQQQSIKALATPIDQRSADDVLPRNRYGRLAALTGGFAQVARSYNPGSAAPALDFANQLALDMTDGSIDGHDASGLPVAAAGLATYQPTEANLNWTVGQGLLSRRFGRTSTLQDADPYIDTMFVWLGYSTPCQAGNGETHQRQYFLSSVGTVTSVDAQAQPGDCLWNPGYTKTTQLNHLTGIRRIVGNVLGNRGFAITLTGDLLAWGWQMCGRLGDGVTADTISQVPTRVEGLSRVVDVVAAGDMTLALTATGEVYTWGTSYNGLLGLGELADAPHCADRITGTVPAMVRDVRTVPRPVKVPGLAHVTAIAANDGFATAVLADGRVFQWGAVRNADGTQSVAGTPRQVLDIGSPTQVTANHGMAYAIVGGKVVTWWVWPDEVLEGESAASASPPRVLKNVDHVVGLASDPIGITLALRDDGGGLIWGSWSSWWPETGTQRFQVTPRPWSDYPLRLPDGAMTGRLPRIVRVQVSGNLATAIGADNVTYGFATGRTLAESYWYSTKPFEGLPAPY